MNIPSQKRWEILWEETSLSIMLPNTRDRLAGKPANRIYEDYIIWNGQRKLVMNYWHPVEMVETLVHHSPTEISNILQCFLCIKKYITSNARFTPLQSILQKYNQINWGPVAEYVSLNICYQQDGAPPHYGLVKRARLVVRARLVELCSEWYIDLLV